MSTTMTLQEAQANLPDLIHQLTPGDSIVITENDQPVAKLMSQKPAVGQRPVAELRPASQPKPRPQFGACKGMLTIVTEDEEHLQDFAEYMS